MGHLPFDKNNRHKRSAVEDHNHNFMVHVSDSPPQKDRCPQMLEKFTLRFFVKKGVTA